MSFRSTFHAIDTRGNEDIASHVERSAAHVEYAVDTKDDSDCFPRNTDGLQYEHDEW